MLNPVFQSPFSGDLDCEEKVEGRGEDKGEGFQSPFSGDLDCEWQDGQTLRKFIVVLSIPVFRGSRLRGSLSRHGTFIADIPFNPRFQGISIARLSPKLAKILLQSFQSPFSGDLDCEEIEVA